MSYTTEELKAPTFTVDDKGMKGKRTLRLADWGDIDDLMDDLLGSQFQAGAGLVRVPMATFPGRSHLLLKSVNISPFNDKITTDSNGVASCENGAVIELNYETRPYETKEEDKDDQDPETFLTHDIDVQQQLMNHGQSTLKWQNPATGQSDQVPADAMPGFPVTIVNHTLTWHYVPNPPLSRWYGLAGKINDSTFLNHAKETVLFAGLNVGTQTDYAGGRKSEVKMTFQARIIQGTLATGAGSDIGWNHFLRQDGKWDRIVNKNDDLILETADFDTIFKYS